MLWLILLNYILNFIFSIRATISRLASTSTIWYSSFQQQWFLFRVRFFFVFVVVSYSFHRVYPNFGVLFMFYSLYQNDGKFYIVNLITQEGELNGFFNDSCYYSNTGGEIAASKRKQPEHSWTHYKCSYRREIGNVIFIFMWSQIC